MLRIEDIVHVSSPDWPGRALQVLPGDLSQFAPNGNGVGGALLPTMPYDGSTSLRARRDFYGFHGRVGHPLRDAPLTEPSAGILYFGQPSNLDDLAAAMRIMGVATHAACYAAFVDRAHDPRTQGFLVQLRLVSEIALRFMFAATKQEIASLPAQPHTLGALVPAFLAQQEDEWCPKDKPSPLTGCMGGDGDWADEDLCFGFMVDNSYHGVYRLWSRAWVVTK